MTKDSDDDFHAAKRGFKNRAAWKPMLDALMELAESVHADRQSDTLSDAVSQQIDDKDEQQ